MKVTYVDQFVVHGVLGTQLLENNWTLLYQHLRFRLWQSICKTENNTAVLTFLSPRFCYRGNCCFSTNAARPRVCSDTARLFNWSIEALIRPCIWYQNYFGVWVPGTWWFMILARVSWNESETATIVRISSENTYYSNDIIWTYCCHWWKIHYLLPLWLIFSLWRLQSHTTSSVTWSGIFCEIYIHLYSSYVQLRIFIMFDYSKLAIKGDPNFTSYYILTPD